MLKNDKELLELYLDNFDIKDSTNDKFYNECKFNLNLLKEQECLEHTIPKNNMKNKAKKF